MAPILRLKAYRSSSDSSSGQSRPAVLLCNADAQKQTCSAFAATLLMPPHILSST